MSELEFLYDRFVDWLEENALWVTIGTSGALIIFVFSVNLLAQEFIGGIGFFWSIVMIGLGYLLSLGFVTLYHSIWTNDKRMLEVESVFNRIIAPVLMLISTLTVIGLTIFLNGGLFIPMFFLSFSGFFIYHFNNRNTIKEGSDRVRSEISYRRHTDDRIL